MPPSGFIEKHAEFIGSRLLRICLRLMILFYLLDFKQALLLLSLLHHRRGRYMGRIYAYYLLCYPSPRDRWPKYIVIPTYIFLRRLTRTYGEILLIDFSHAAFGHYRNMSRLI